MYIRVTSDNIKKTQDKINDEFGFVKFLTKSKKADNELAFITPEMVEKAIDSKINAIELDGANVIGKIRVLDI